MVWSRGKSGKPDSTQQPSASKQGSGGAAGEHANEMPVAPQGADAEHADKRASYVDMAERAQKAQFAQLFAQAVAVLMRDKVYRKMPLGDLEFLVVPAIASGQVAIAHAKAGGNGPMVPVAVALWASVSADIDKALAANLDKPLILKPNQWKTGDQTWLITLAGEQTAVGSFVKQLMEKDFKGKTVKMRTFDHDGKRAVKTLAG